MSMTTEDSLKEVLGSLQKQTLQMHTEQISLIDSLDDRLDLNEAQKKRCEETYWLEEDEFVKEAYIQEGQLHIIIAHEIFGGVKGWTNYEPSMDDEDDKLKLAYILYGGINEWK